jgi:glutaredoxin
MRHTTRLLLSTALLTLQLQPAWALYKVVGPDGRVTYTDRAPTDRPAKALKTSAGGADTASLPYELRKAAERYPVLLYTSSTCSPCDTGRNLLKSRGVPFVELTINSGDDVRAYATKEGTDQLPLLRVGSQQVKGFSAQEWTSYLDAANYPASSQLPADYVWPPASPMAPVSKPEPRPERNSPAPDGSPSGGADNGGDGGKGSNTPPGFRF